MTNSNDCCGGNCSPEGIQAPDKNSLEHFVEVLQNTDPDPIERLDLKGFGEAPYKGLTTNVPLQTKEAYLVGLKSLRGAMELLQRSPHIEKSLNSLNESIAGLQGDIDNSSK